MADPADTITLEAPPSPGKQWLSDFTGDFATGAGFHLGGRLLGLIPGVKGMDKWLQSAGNMSMMYAAPGATANSFYRAKGWDKDTPKTVGEHTKKWVRSAGTEAAIGGGLMAAGMLLSAIPHPATATGGRLLTLLGKTGPFLTTVGRGTIGYAPLNASFGTLADVLGNRAERMQQQRLQQQQRMNELQQRYQRDSRNANYMGAGIGALAGLGGAYMLVNTIPALKRKKYLKYLAYLAAAGGAGYAGWKYTQNQNNKYQMV